MNEYEYNEFTQQIDRENGLEFYALGLCEEAGEVAGKIKRIHRDDNDQLTLERRAQILTECGDVLWYMTRIVDKIGSTMADVRNANYDKLSSRLKRGVLHGSGDNR